MNFLQKLLNWIPLAGLYKREVCVEEFRYFNSECQNGSIILTYTPNAWGNIFIEGKWKHAAVYISNEIYEATSHGARRTPMKEFLETKKAYKVLTPTFLNAIENHRFCEYIEDAVRRKVEYDWLFSSKNNKFYCSELILEGFRSSSEEPIPIRGFGKIITPTELDNEFMEENKTFGSNACSFT